MFALLLSTSSGLARTTPNSLLPFPLYSSTVVDTFTMSAAVAASPTHNGQSSSMAQYYASKVGELSEVGSARNEEMAAITSTIWLWVL